MKSALFTALRVFAPVPVLCAACGARSDLALESDGLDGTTTTSHVDDSTSTLPDETTTAAKSAQTWILRSHNPDLGTDLVGCDEACDPYVGDTSCQEERPMLCVLKDGSPNPGVMVDFYTGWIGGTIALTPPVTGTLMTSKSAADGLCEMYVGSGYEMAEFHHPGGGWNFWAFGNIDGSTRFWVRIDDQPANCWD